MYYYIFLRKDFLSLSFNSLPLMSVTCSGSVSDVRTEPLCRFCFNKRGQLTLRLSARSLRSVSDPGSDAVPCWLGFKQGPAVLRPRRGSVPGRALLHGLGLLHRHGRHRAHLRLRRLLCSGRDRHLQRQSPGGDRGGEEPHLPPLRITLL